MIIMSNPTKLSRKKFNNIEKTNPKRARRISSRASGEIFGLHPSGSQYTSNETIEVIYNEGSYVDGVE